MFIGHHAAAFAGKRAAPRVSLGTMFAAAMALDLLWPLFTLAGLEHFRVDPGNTPFTPLDFYDYPISHSLLTSLGWSIVFAAIHYAMRRSPRGALVVGAAVFSHWVLDFVTHRADLPLWPGGPKVGLGLWYSVPATVIVESALFLGAIALHVRATRARDRIGSVALWSLVAFAAVIYIVSLTSPPPPSWQAVAWAANAAWLFVPWAAWIDRHREARA
ncbi:MAG TPA: metal-dependent hydrolase [Thermoanaerobaculia bacterium]|jgi:membrane-bound metal-dependent hydrolase YbcI (DUF457 family)